MFKFASYGKFGFSRPDFDGNKIANGMCLAKIRELKKCLFSSTKDHHFFFTELKSVAKVLNRASVKANFYRKENRREHAAMCQLSQAKSCVNHRHISHAQD